MQITDECLQSLNLQAELTNRFQTLQQHVSNDLTRLIQQVQKRAKKAVKKFIKHQQDYLDQHLIKHRLHIPVL